MHKAEPAQRDESYRIFESGVRQLSDSFNQDSIKNYYDNSATTHYSYRNDAGCGPRSLLSKSRLYCDPP
jgi:hypothetical protein